MVQLFKNMWKENVDKREGKHYSFCHRMQCGRDGESNLFIWLCPAMCCSMGCILENLPWDPQKLILFVMEATREYFKTIVLLKADVEKLLWRTFHSSLILWFQIASWIHIFIHSTIIFWMSTTNMNKKESSLCKNY